MIFYTKDEKYVIKTISKQERIVFLKRLLDSYIQRVTEQAKSKLIRILGVFKVLPSNVCFILMERSGSVSSDCLLYDLKGSTVDRFVSDYQSSSVLKDLNFITSGVKVILEPEESEELIQILKDDFRVLRNVGVMDYSVLMFLYKNQRNQERPCKYQHYCVGETIVISVIDLFQVYNSSKAIERWYKIYIRRVSKQMLSAISPQEYYERIVKFIENVFQAKGIQEMDSLSFY